jgi:hypothetical protein
MLERNTKMHRAICIVLDYLACFTASLEKQKILLGSGEHRDGLLAERLSVRILGLTF